MNEEYKRGKGPKTEYYIPELNKWVSNRSIRRELSKIGLTINHYYNRYFLGIDDPNYLPKCKNPNCNNLVHSFGLGGGYGKYCSVSCESKANWMNPDFRDKELNNNPTHGPNGLMGYIMSNNEMYSNWKSKSPGCMEGGLHKYLVSNKCDNYLKLMKDGGSFGRKYSSSEGFSTHPKGKYLTGIYKSPKCSREVNYRSSYELKFLEIIDNDDSIVSFEYESIHIPYIGTDGKNHTYIVDFLINLNNDDKILVEIKPKYRVINDCITKIKIEAAKEFSKTNGFIYKVVTEGFLFSDERLNLNEIDTL